MERKIVIVLIAIFLIAPVLIALTKPGFFPTQDFIYVARIYEMDKSLKDGQFPVRWVPDFRYGEPLYNFYAPLAYYAGSVVHTLGFNFLSTTKILFALGFILSGLAMFFLGKKLFGVGGGLVAATLYLYAPYHSVDVYVRGALSESWALIFFPLIFLTVLNLKERQTVRNCLYLSFSLAGLFYTHNIMTMLFMPFVLGLMVFLLIQEKSAKLLLYFLTSLIWGFCLAASFLLPAYIEKDFIQTDHLLKGYFDFRGHFVAWPQFFSTFWGYGASVWGTDDGMSFQVGLIHWILFALASLGLVINRRGKYKTFLILVGLEFLFSLFMQHNRSAFIWEKLPVLAYVQFPWRFLGISIFLVSLIGGGVAELLPKRFNVAILAVLVIVVVFVNYGYFHPESFYLDSQDSHYISDQVLSKDDKLPKDYLPIWVKKIRAEKLEAQVLNGKSNIENFQKGSNWAKLSISSEEDSLVELPITYFPGWQVWINGKQERIEKPGELGLLRIESVKGRNDIKLRFGDTLVRILGNLLSIVAFIPAVTLGFYFLKLNYRKSK